MKKEIKVNVPEHIKPILKASDLTIEDIIESFLFDLGQCCHGSSGSDERDMAKDYFLRACNNGAAYELLLGVFEDLQQLRYDWMDYGNPKKKEYEQHESETIKHILKTLTG